MTWQTPHSTEPDARIKCPPARIRRSRQERASGTTAWKAPVYSLACRRRRALLMTETELRLIAAPASIGLRSSPKKG